MRSEFILLVIIGGFLTALIVFLIILYKPAFPPVLNQSTNKETAQAAASDTNVTGDLKSKIKQLEENMNILSQQQKEQIQASTQSAKTVTSTSGKSIIALANTQASLFTTTSATYTPMGMYVNVNCPKSCLLWINFYSSSKNLGTPVSAQGYFNTYDVFLDNSDRSIFAQASYPAAGSSIPVSLNVTIPAAAGTHTVDIRAKTTGGTLQSDSSALQVMAIEK